MSHGVRRATLPIALLTGLALVLLTLVPGAAGQGTSSPTPGRVEGDQASSYAPVMVVLDISGSMSDPADADGKISKIQAARSAVVNLAGAIAADQTFGLLSYPGGEGEPDADGCSTGSVNIALGKPDAQQTSDVVSGLQPDDETPTSPALLHAAAELKATGAAHSVIVLVSDGMANCGPPVCETARKIRDQGVELTVNTVGFDVESDETARADLQCVADATGGIYEDVNDPDALREALQKAAASWLEVQADVPTQLRTAVGQGSQLGTPIPVTVRNAGQQTAPDVRVSLDFLDSRRTGGALLVPRPIRFLGNLAPGESRTVTIEVRPAAAAAGKEFSWVATATTRNGAGNAATGTTRVVASLKALGALLKDVDGSVAILGDSYSSGEGAGYANYVEGTYANNAYPQECRQPVPDPFKIPEVCRKGKPWSACHRSTKAYGGVLFGRRAELIACSSAVTAHMTTSAQRSGRVEVPIQVDALEELVSKKRVGAALLTIGGNDIQFGSLVQACGSGGNCKGTWPISGPGATGNANIDLVNKLGPSLWRVYSGVDAVLNSASAVKARGGKTAPVVVLPYVRILPSTPTQSCFFGFSKEETTELNTIVARLNTAIATVVRAKAEAGRPFYLASDVEDAFLPGHTLCAPGKESWAVGWSIRNNRLFWPDGDRNQLAHPNVDGYAAEAEALAGWSAHAKQVAVRGVPEKTIAPPTWLDRHFQVPALGDFVPSGGNIAMSGAGFTPGSPVTAVVASEPLVVGAGVADKQGRVRLSVSLPTDLPRGRHHLHLTGFGSDGPVQVSRGLWVLPRYTQVALFAILGALVLLTVVGVRSRRGRPASAS